jgi:hypothetical protein
MLRECETTPFYSYYNWSIAFGIFFKLGRYLQLVILVWSVNMVLRERVGSGRGVYKGVCLAIVIIMGAITAGLIGLSSYNLWTVTPAGQDSFHDSLGDQELQLSVAYWVLYMLSVLAGGALALVSLFSMRSKQVPVGVRVSNPQNPPSQSNPPQNLLGWTIAVTVCMFIWSLVMLVDWAASLPTSNNPISTEGEVAINYIISFFQIFAYICVLFLAKSAAWDNLAVHNPTQPNMYHNAAPMPYGAPVPPPQQQYGYNGQPQQHGYNGQPQQQYYYQEMPVHTGAVHNGAMPVNGQNGGHVMHVK